MKSVFLDTGYLLALELSNDQNHRAALKHWRSSVKSLPLIISTSYVFDEIVTFFNSRGYHAKAVEVGNRLLSSPSVQLVHVDEALFREGWQYLQKYKDKEYSLTDCISFIVMKNFGIDTAFAFDKHFAQAGFKKVP
ncbi:MAG: PIN domain-containing protein [Acidobacteriota bacterium]|nr:PIN domain-containing protein [Acidobacteriota bacterium]